MISDASQVFDCGVLVSDEIVAGNLDRCILAAEAAEQHAFKRSTTLELVEAARKRCLEASRARDEAKLLNGDDVIEAVKRAVVASFEAQKTAEFIKDDPTAKKKALKYAKDAVDASTIAMDAARDSHNAPPTVLAYGQQQRKVFSTKKKEDGLSSSSRKSMMRDAPDGMQLRAQAQTSAQIAAKEAQATKDYIAKLDAAGGSMRLTVVNNASSAMIRAKEHAAAVMKFEELAKKRVNEFHGDRRAEATALVISQLAAAAKSDADAAEAAFKATKKSPLKKSRSGRVLPPPSDSSQGKKVPFGPGMLRKTDSPHSVDVVTTPPAKVLDDDVSKDLEKKDPPPKVVDDEAQDPPKVDDEKGPSSEAMKDHGPPKDEKKDLQDSDLLDDDAEKVPIDLDVKPEDEPEEPKTVVTMSQDERAALSGQELEARSDALVVLAKKEKTTAYAAEAEEIASEALRRASQFEDKNFLHRLFWRQDPHATIAKKLADKTKKNATICKKAMGAPPAPDCTDELPVSISLRRL